MSPGAWTPPVSSDRPVPGYAGNWWVDTNNTRGSSQNTSCVPLPWWTSQSTIEHPFAARRERGRGDRDVVEQAEALPPRRDRVVAGRADDDERGLGLAAGQRFRRRAAHTRRRGWPRRRIPSATTVSASSIPPPPRANSAERVDVALVVHEGELGLRRVAAAIPHDGIVEVRVGHAGDRSFHPADAFRMTAAGVVGVGIGRNDDEQTRRHRRPVDPRFRWQQARPTTARGGRSRAASVAADPGDVRPPSGRARDR